MLNRLKQLVGIETKLDKAVAAISQAVAQQPINAMQAVQDWLDHSAPAMAKDRDTLEILNAVDTSFRQIFDAAMAAMVQAQLNHTRLSVLLQTAVPFCDRILSFYTEALKRDVEGLARQPSNTPLVQTAVTHWLYWIGRDHVVRFVRQPRADQLPWNDIRPLTEFALKLDGGLAAKLGRPDGEAGRLQKQLSHLVLLSRTLTPDLQGRQILVADRIADALSGFIKVSDTHTDQTPFGQASDANNPPTMLTQSSGAGGKGLFYGLDKSLMELAALETLITSQNKVPPKVDPYGTLDVAETLAVIRHLKNRWSGRDIKRQADRKAIQGKLKIAHDFSILRQMISLAANPNTSLRGVYGTSETCEVEDVSATGIGVILNGHKGWAKIGLLVGLKTENDINWRIGVIRRVQPVRHEVVQVGIQFLSRDPESVRVTVRAQVSDWEKISDVQSYDNNLAIYLRPEALNQNAHLLICNKNDLKVGSRYGIPGCRDGDLLVRIIEQAELGPDSVIYRVEPSAARPTSSAAI